MLNKSSDQPAHSHSLIRIFSGRILDRQSDAKFLHADKEDSDQTAGCAGGFVFVERICHIAVQLNKIRKKGILSLTALHAFMYLMSRDTVFPTRLQVRPAKTQISLRIRAVGSESSLSA